MVALAKKRSQPTWPTAMTFLVLFAAASASAQSKSPNTIASVRTSQSNKGMVEIAVTSDQPFTQSDIPVLRIGSQEITISGPAEDGSLNKRVFFLTAEQFQRVKPGEVVTFQYGRGEGKQRRDFGTLDKSKLDK